MQRTGWAALVLLILPLWAAPAAVAAKRVALVIGNAKYVHEERLANPGNDAREVAAALQRIGFDEVEVVLDADLIAMQSALARFARSTGASDLALIYYSGHGIEVDGRNYLIPTSAKLADAGDVDFEAVPLELAIAAADRAGRVKILVLDACRSNPFRTRMVRRQGKRSVGRGLAPPKDVAHGMLVAYAARAGTEAFDGPPGGTSPFTSAFLKFVEEPRVEVRLFLGKVRDEVVRATGQQEPFTYLSLGGEEVFLNAVRVPPKWPPPSAPPPARLSEAAEAWSVTRDTGSVAVLETFIQRFGDTYYADVAKVRLAELRQAEEARQAEAAKTRAEEDARAKAQVERERLAMLQRDAERKRAEAEATADAERRVLDRKADIREAQERLYELNYDPGSADGQLTRQTEQAVREFETRLGVAPTGRLTAGLLDQLKSAGKLVPWGAIVFSDTTQQWGMSWSHDTRKAAVAAAQASCGPAPSVCSRALTFFGTGCGAFAHSEKRWSLVARDTSAKARLAAIEECQKEGTRCSIVASVCAGGQNRTQ
jgi:uncharacterized caspase-like protein